VADPQGFLKVRSRELPLDRPVSLRLLDFREVHAELEPDQVMLKRQAGRCMDCGVPFCHRTCPLGNVCPDWNDMVWRGQWADASAHLHATNNFPEFTGRVCPALCEGGCVLGISQSPVTIKNIEVSIIDRAWADGLVTPVIPPRLTGYTVAVVGSGPAGLAAAQQLTRAGHTVAVYERDDKPGGLLRYGIPDFKLDKHHIDRRVAQMEAEGTRFRTGLAIGVDISWDELHQRYDAVVIATGSTIPRDLPLPGRDLAGIHFAKTYLDQSNRAAGGDAVADQILATERDVIVIGGGDTGSDCVGTALRQGAESVTSLEILARPPEARPEHQPWPTYPAVYRMSTSHQEGGQREYRAASLEYLGSDGVLKGLRIAQAERDESGQFRPVPGTERTLPADLVLIAMGFVGPEAVPAVEQLGLELTGRGTFVRDAAYATPTAGVFVAGDAGRGQSLVVWAIAEGRACAAAVDRYLQGSTELGAPIVATEAPIGL
jgi:glutamate synthase (NADPH/NADH) small chain